MSKDSEHPQGSSQAISAAAMTLLAVYVAVVGTLSYNARQDDFSWHPADFIFLVMGLATAACLGLVPLVATRPAQSPEEAKSLTERARLTYLTGHVLAILCILGNVARDFAMNHVAS